MILLTSWWSRIKTVVLWWMFYVLHCTSLHTEHVLVGMHSGYIYRLTSETPFVWRLRWWDIDDRMTFRWWALMAWLAILARMAFCLGTYMGSNDVSLVGHSGSNGVSLVGLSGPNGVFLGDILAQMMHRWWVIVAPMAFRWWVLVVWMAFCLGTYGLEWLIAGGS